MNGEKIQNTEPKFMAPKQYTKAECWIDCEKGRVENMIELYNRFYLPMFSKKTITEGSFSAQHKPTENFLKITGEKLQN